MERPFTPPRATCGHTRRAVASGRLAAQRGAAVVETVGVALVISVILAAAAYAMGSRASSRPASAAIAQVLTSAVRGTASSSRILTRSANGVAMPMIAFGTKVSDKRDPLTPVRNVSLAITPQWYWWQQSNRVRLSGSHWQASVATNVCVLCAKASAAFDGVRPEKGTSPKSSAVTKGGLVFSASGDAFLALAAAQATETAQTQLGNLNAAVKAKEAVVAGAVTNGQAELQLASSGQALTLSGEAALGGRARAEEQTQASIAGIGIEQTAAVEGWAGLGATGRVELSHMGGRFTFGGRIGGAVGVGGAMDLQISINASPVVHEIEEVTHAAALGIDRARRRLGRK